MKETYQALSRRYRPQNFAAVTGQEVIVKTLKNALRMGRIAHAYLFYGSRGTGKTTLARVFAKALQCEALSESFEPCNSCETCKNISLGKSLDIFEIDGASHRGIDDIRQINETVGYAASSGKYKIYIIDEVHMLTKEAFNALLKTLEEPPEKVLFFFATTEVHKLPPTILSRCQRFDLRRIGMQDIANKLSLISQDLGIDAEEGGLKLIAEAAEGSLRDAESLFDQILCYADKNVSEEMVRTHLGKLPKSTFFNLDLAIHEGNFSFAFELAESLFSTGKDLDHFVKELLEHFRLLLASKLRPQDSALQFLSEKDLNQYKKNAALYTQEQCLYYLEFLQNFSLQTPKNAFTRITLESLILHLLQNRHRISLPKLVQKLIHLESSLLSQKPEEEKPITPSIETKLEESPTLLVQELLAIQEPQPIQVAAPELPAKEKTISPILQQKQETLLRFAGIELEGTIHKDHKQ